MTLKLKDTYSEFEAPSSSYPNGGFKNATTSGGTDGTPLEKLWADDWLGFTDALHAAASQTYSGSPDTALASDRLKALFKLFSRIKKTISIPETGGITGGDISRTGANQITVGPTSCLDSTRMVPLSVDSAQAITGLSSVNALYHIYIVRKVSDGACEFRKYASEAAAAADGTVDAYRWLDGWGTNGAGAVKGGITLAGVHWNTLFSENTINSMTAVPAGMATGVAVGVAHLGVDRVSHILVGAQGYSGNSSVAIFGVGTVSGIAMSSYVISNSYLGATDINQWAKGECNQQFMPFVDGSVYWGYGSYTESQSAQLGIQAYVLRR